MGSPESPLVELQRCQQSLTVQEANDRKMQMYHVSIGRIMLTLGLLVFISTVGSGKATNTSDFGGCMYAHYMVNETCFRCPENCTICVSDTNCTLCRKGFYGPVCENTCDFNCTGTCHKEYGHCTYGCPDGTYPADDNSCQSCSNMCLLCASKSHCIDCRKSHFLDVGQCRLHGSTEKTRSATVLVVVTTTVIATFIVIGVLVLWVLYKRKSVIKKKNTNDTELPTLENVELTIPLSTKDGTISSVKAECIAGKEEIFPKSTSQHDDDDISDISADVVVLLSAEDVIPCQNLENMSEEAPGTVPEPEQEMREIHKPQDDGSSYMDTGTMPSEFGAQLKFKPYDTQQLSPTETFSGTATLPNTYYQDSPQIAIKHTSATSKGHLPYARPKSNTHDVRKEDLISQGANQIYNKQFERYT